MDKIGENKQKAKFLGVILLVALIGLGSFTILFSYLYNETLEGGACNLCYELNPGLSACENYTPINIGVPNFSGLEFYPPLNYNERKT